MKLTIDRSKWARGLDDMSGYCTQLLSIEDGRMCCLGFLSLAAGLKPETIENKGCVAHVGIKAYELPETLRFLIGPDNGNSHEAGSLMGINDDPAISEATREDHLTQMFAKKGIEVEFVN